jgi:uncharacterized protein YodC (DUF2158 family)
MKVGDLVQLKSGGPCMTVLDVKATVKCGWFTGGRYYDACFPAECIEGSVKIIATFPSRPPMYSYNHPHVIPLNTEFYTGS